MTGRKGEALDENEAVAVLQASEHIANDMSDGDDYWHQFLVALNDQDVVLVWDGPAEVASEDDGYTEAEEAAYMAGQHAVAKALIQFAKVYDLDQAVEIR